MYRVLLSVCDRILTELCAILGQISTIWQGFLLQDGLQEAPFCLALTWESVLLVDKDRKKKKKLYKDCCNAVREPVGQHWMTPSPLLCSTLFYISFCLPFILSEYKLLHQRGPGCKLWSDRSHKPNAWQTASKRAERAPLSPFNGQWRKIQRWRKQQSTEGSKAIKTIAGYHAPSWCPIHSYDIC